MKKDRTVTSGDIKIRRPKLQDQVRQSVLSQIKMKDMKCKNRACNMRFEGSYTNLDIGYIKKKN